MVLFGDPLKKYSKKLKKMYDEKHRLEDIYEKTDSIKSRMYVDTCIKEIDSYIENVYAKAVFEHYSVKQPELVRVKTNEVYTWKQAFGESFEDIPANLRQSLVGLVEKTGRYRLKK